MIRAFVFSTYVDLKEHRAYVIGGLTAAGISVDPMEKWTAASDEPKEQFSKHTAGSQAGAPASFVPPSFVDEQHVPPGCPTLER